MKASANHDKRWEYSTNTNLCRPRALPLISLLGDYEGSDNEGSGHFRKQTVKFEISVFLFIK